MRDTVNEKSKGPSKELTLVSGESLSVEVRVREIGTAEIDLVSAWPFGAKHERLARWLVLGAVLLIAGLYVGLHMRSGWVPADDGTLAQSAVRVLDGQLPQRDFIEGYTGGLSMIHALAFRLFGVNLMALRICVFLFFLAWIPAVYYIALRFIPSLAAGFITLLAVSWGFPNYPAAMPSWYNLFFATFGAAALLRFLDLRARRWLAMAGVCGGVSILIKVIGAYYIAGVLLFLVFLAQSDADSDSAARTSVGYRIFSVASLLAFLGTVIYLMHSRLTTAELYHFVLPSAAVVGLILFGERNVFAGSGERFKTLFRLLIPFFVGVAVPVVLFLAPYAMSGALHSFFSGVTSSAVVRASGLAVIRPAPVQYVVYVLPLLGLLLAAMYWDKFQGAAVGSALVLGALVMAVRAKHSESILSGIWFSAVMLTPIVVALGVAFLLIGRARKGRATIDRQRVMVLVALAATCSLVQYPFAAPIYLCYALPLTLLALTAIIATNKTQRGIYAFGAIAALYLVFGVASLIPMHLAELTHEVGQMNTLQLPRGGVEIEGSVFFEQLTHLLQQHSPNGLLYAGNDCPELYFLSGLKNVTRDDSGAAPEEVLRALQSNDLKVFVINEAPFFEVGKMNKAVRAEVERKFPAHVQVGIFQIFWRE